MHRARHCLRMHTAWRRLYIRRCSGILSIRKWAHPPRATSAPGLTEGLPRGRRKGEQRHCAAHCLPPQRSAAGCTNIYVYIHIHTHTRTHTHIYIYINMHLYTYIYTYIYARGPRLNARWMRSAASTIAAVTDDSARAVTIAFRACGDGASVAAGLHSMICGTDEPSPGADVGGVSPNPGADVGGVSPSPGADVTVRGRA
jgi:hypothetical protein